MAQDLIPFIEQDSRPLVKRGISQATCEKWDYTVAKYKDGWVQVANYKNESNQIVAQKIRFPAKDFTVFGDLKAAQPLYGQWLWRDGGKKVVITEGEIDALSVSQVQNNKWPVVSVPNGAQGAVKAIAKAIDWLVKFEEVIFMFDNDDPGRAAAEKCAAILPPGKAKIATLPLKDANELLQKGRGAEIIDAIWGAKEWRPDGMVTLEDLRERVLAPMVLGAPWAWPTLDRATYGRRAGEVYTLGAGTGVGKTDLFTQQIAYDLMNLDVPVGVFFLEQHPAETVKRIAGKVSGKRFHVPDAGWKVEELVDTIDLMETKGTLYLYNHFGGMDWNVMKNHIRYLAVNGVRHIYIDHLTALAAGSDKPEKDALEELMAEVAGLAQEHGLIVHMISHLATPDGKPHEEGGRVMIRHFKGSRAIGFWSYLMVGMERDQQADSPEERKLTTIRVLKDRYTGQATGLTFYLTYDEQTGLLHETDGDCPFDGEL